MSGIRSLTLKNISFLFIEKLLVSFYRMLYVIITLYCETLTDQFWSLRLNLRKEYMPVHFTVHHAAALSHYVINKHQ